VHQSIRRATAPAKDIEVMRVEYALCTTPRTTRGRTYRSPPGSRTVRTMESNVGTLHRPRRGVDVKLILLEEKHQSKYCLHDFGEQLPVGPVQLGKEAVVLVEGDHVVKRMSPRWARTVRMGV
jgi:hypothetical protein